MLKWALIFFIISIVAGALGFTGIARGAAGIAKILFVRACRDLRPPRLRRDIPDPLSARR
jgi:uncharacterized membrane protein YtjA (UPF0391 family)